MSVLPSSHLCCNAFPVVLMCPIATVPYQNEKGKRIFQSWTAGLILLWFYFPFWYTFNDTCATCVLQAGLCVQLDVVKVRQTLQFAARFVSCLFCDFDLHFYFLGYGLFFFLVMLWKEAVTLWPVLGILENGNCDQESIACHWAEPCLTVLQERAVRRGWGWPLPAGTSSGMFHIALQHLALGTAEPISRAAVPLRNQFERGQKMLGGGVLKTIVILKKKKIQDRTPRSG